MSGFNGIPSKHIREAFGVEQDETGALVAKPAHDAPLRHLVAGIHIDAVATGRNAAGGTFVGFTLLGAPVLQLRDIVLVTSFYLGLDRHRARITGRSATDEIPQRVLADLL